MGEEAATWYAALQDATQATRWLHGGHEYRVSPRPLLPDEDSTAVPPRSDPGTMTAVPRSSLVDRLA